MNLHPLSVRTSGIKTYPVRRKFPEGTKMAICITVIRWRRLEPKHSYELKLCW